MKSISVAPAPVGEVATKRPAIDSHSLAADPSPACIPAESANQLDSRASLLTVTRERARALLDYLKALFTDPVEFPESVYKILRCKICRADVHREGEMCPKQWSGQCVICGPVLLDYYGNCPSDPRAHRRTHVILPKSRHATTQREWIRSRFHVAKSTPENTARKSSTNGGSPTTAS